MKKIKIISDKDDENLDLLLNTPQDIQESCGWYLHGELEDILDYDLGSIYNLEEFPENLIDTCIISSIGSNTDKMKHVKKSHFDGIYPVKVLGIKEPCIGYFWIVDEEDRIFIDYNENSISYKTWQQRGLVVLESDIEGKKYAEKCYQERRKNL